MLKLKFKKYLIFTALLTIFCYSTPVLAPNLSEANLHALGILLNRAALLNNTEKIKELLRAGAKPNEGIARQALVNAVANNNLEAARMLLQAEANPNSLEPDALVLTRFPVLHAAVGANNIPMVKLLFTYGADLDLMAPITGHLPEKFAKNEEMLEFLKKLRHKKEQIEYEKQRIEDQRLLEQLD